MIKFGKISYRVVCIFSSLFVCLLFIVTKIIILVILFLIYFVVIEFTVLIIFGLLY